MKHIVGLLFLMVLSVPTCAQPTIQDQARYRAELDKAFEPLKTLNHQQMVAVAGLVLAARAGLSIDEYCPPLKQFAAEPKVPCLSAIIAYARARSACKSENLRKCPKLLEADANWAACETKVLGERLQALKIVTRWPKPSPPIPVSK